MDFEVISPKTREELVDTISQCQGKNFRFGAGYTDLINQFKDQSTEGLTVINIAQLDDDEFIGISQHDDFIEIGALATASDFCNSELIRKDYPVLYEAARSVASIQIRNAATVGGNICNASPSADMSAALVALKAVCCVLDVKGNEREELLETFIQGVRKTSLAENEILRAIKVPVNVSNNIRSGFLKVGTRNSMEISIVSLSYHFQLDDEGIIVEAGISIGAVAPTIPFVEEACNFIKRKKFSEFSDQKLFADIVLLEAKPISDIRATDWYRREVLNNLCHSIFE